MTSFDERAATWDDDPGKVERAAAVAAAIRAAVPLTPTSRLLEYGAGTGLLAQQLAVSVGAVTLADSSAGMRAVAESKVSAGALPAGTRVWDLDLAAAEPPDEQFDLIATMMALHHIHDVPRVLAGFARLLRPGGHVGIVDLVAEPGSFHRHGDFDGHHGFEPEQLAGWLGDAGFTDVQVLQPVHEVVREVGRFPLFLATARRPE